MSETTGDKVYSGIAEFGKIKAGIGMVVAGFISFIFFVIGLYLVFRKEKYTQHIQGRITSSICNNVTSSDNKQSFDCDLTVVYSVNGTEYTFKGVKNSNVQYVIGTSVDLFLNPENPQDASFSTTPRWAGWLLMGISLIVALVAGANFYLTTRFKGYAAFSGASSVASVIGGGRRGIVSPFF